LPEYRGCRVPEHLQYDLEYHVWVKTEGDVVVVGATDPAQAYAGEIINIGIKRPGTRLERGGILATVESAKFMGPMRAPITGTVVEVNQEVARRPSLINGDAYGNWAVRMKLEKPEELRLLVPGREAAERYRPIIDEWGIECRGSTG